MADNIKYVDDLPFDERRELCCILDEDNIWLKLGRKMHFETCALNRLQKSDSSPSDSLLRLWGTYNHTILELFAVLHKINQFEAMSVIKQFVDKKYHSCIKENNHIKMINRDFNTKVPAVDFDNYHSEKILNECKHINLEDNPQIVSDENNIALSQRPKSPVKKTDGSKMFSGTEMSNVDFTTGTPHILYEELRKSTNNWDEKTILGKGGFGTVYKGTWKCTQVAIKRLAQKEYKDRVSEDIKQSNTELRCLNAYRHDNILPLYGYSNDGVYRCLIYQYMSGGSLDYRLRSKDPNQVPLSWPSRLNIAIGVARGLQFLHTTLQGEKPLVHGDIKSANILLDPTDQPRIGDFGLAREGPHNNYTHIKVSKIQGTRPYLPDEFLRGAKLSTKIDTYSFGVVLFEIGTARYVYFKKDQREVFLKDVILHYEGDILDLKDGRVTGYNDCYKSLIEIGKMCVSVRAKDRPEMVNVLIMLESICQST